MIYPSPKTVADRVNLVYRETISSLDSVGMRLKKAQFNQLSGRVQIEATFLEKTNKQLAKMNLRIFRFGQIFAVIDLTVVENWGIPKPKVVKGAVEV